ncbi:restriction endonuclease pacI-beta-alpha-metal hnh motif 1.97A [Caudoviricetes sp.]|nr:restriction endonuclease pacI-beta-alpha-metal hnh motif 1.97A [Caudoviricetes sp.]UOF78384.1 restriction endonuclease paci restriction endonuclease [Bacteriophage sp.]
MIRSKECFKCNTVKPLSEFYKHSMMADGHLNKCKECTKNDATTHRNKNLEKIRAYDRARGKIPERAKAAQEITAAWRKADTRRVAAHNAVTRAVRKGLLVRCPCVRCGEQKSLAHHEDYDKPLEVMWLCQPCHKQRHKEINFILRSENET